MTGSASESGIHNHDRQYGFRACASKSAVADLDNDITELAGKPEFGGASTMCNCTSGNDYNLDRYRFLPSIGVIVSFASSMPSMQLTLSATTSVPSGLLPRANTSTPQSMHS